MKLRKVLLMLSIVGLLFSTIPTYAQETEPTELPFNLFLPMAQLDDPGAADEDFVLADFPSNGAVTGAATATTTLIANRYVNSSGGSGAQSVRNLYQANQWDDLNDWDKYIEFHALDTAKYTGYRAYMLPVYIDPATIETLRVDANYRGAAKTNQTWTWTIYDWVSKKWVWLGNNANAVANQWTFFSFPAGGILRNYVNPTTRELRIRLQANNTFAAMGLDYEAIHIGYTGGTLAECQVVRSNATTPTFAASHPKVLLTHQATKTCLQGLLASGAPSAARFKAMVDSMMGGEDVYTTQAWYAALLYALTGDATYSTYAIEIVDAFVYSEEAMINRGERPTVSYDSYLGVGEIIGNIMLVYDWCFSRLTSAQRSRWRVYANQAVWNVWHHEQARWGGVAHPWSGWSVDNPLNNYYYSFLRATMILGLASRGENARAQSWLDTFRTTKLENELFPLFNRDLTGGGSREGTGYGTAMKDLFVLYDWWERSTGERIATRTPHTLASLPHMMHNIVPTLDSLAPTGDHSRDSSAAFFDYHREYLLLLMALFPDERLTTTAKSLLAQSALPQMAHPFMYFADFLYNPPDIPAQPLDRLSTIYWGSGTGQILMRANWQPTASFANLICGPFTEGHSHRDQGSFVLYKGTWLAHDANMQSHSGIEQFEEMHNLVRIEQNGTTIIQVEDAPQCNLFALADNNLFSYGYAQVTPIYNGHPVVGKVERAFLFIKPDTFVVFDQVVTAGVGAKRVWTLNTPGMPTVNGDRITYATNNHQLDVYRLAPIGLTTQILPGTMIGENVLGKRLEVAHGTGSTSRFLHVFGLDNAVQSAVSNNVTGQTGAYITLGDGRTVLVRFTNATPGGTLELRTSDGIQYTGPLPTTVTPPALFID